MIASFQIMLMPIKSLHMLFLRTHSVRPLDLLRRYTSNEVRSCLDLHVFDVREYML